MIYTTNIGCKQNLVKAYDSWRTGDVSSDTKEAIANILHTSGLRIYIPLPKAQQQKESSICGVLVLAYVATLAEG